MLLHAICDIHGNTIPSNVKDVVSSSDILTEADHFSSEEVLWRSIPIPNLALNQCGQTGQTVRWPWTKARVNSIDNSLSSLPWFNPLPGRRDSRYVLFSCFSSNPSEDSFRSHLMIMMVWRQHNNVQHIPLTNGSVTFEPRFEHLSMAYALLH